MVCPLAAWETVPQHSHVSEMYAINAGETRLTGEIPGFVKTGK
jgi:hypothetical protein